MCSINGFTWSDEELLKQMNHVTAHRGPDGTGIFTGPKISIGHNRLAIIDLSPNAAQPMKSRDGRFVISFNGEIYNYRELRKELPGYPWKSESDTEVILAAFESWGTAAFARLSGIFAIALWDKKTENLFLVRDPAGIKPLYYFKNGDKLLFASEIKAILQYKEVPRRIDPLALDCFLRVLYVPAPLSMFEGIRKLPQGHILIYQKGHISIAPYLPKENQALSKGSFGELRKDLREHVRSSVASQLVSDRPVGLYLSGGIDSSAVLDGMARASGKVETFSVGFELREGEQGDKFNADFLLARKTAKYFGATHNEVMVSPDEIIPLFEKAVYHLDEPVSNATIIPMLKLSRFARGKVTVVLGGDGGDELFGGYERYRWSLLSSYYRRFPDLSRKALNEIIPGFRKLDTAAGVERFARFHFQKEEVLRPLLTDTAYRAGLVEKFFSERFFSTIEQPFESQFMRADRESWLPDESLLRSDKMSMASGLEARVPLLDLPLIRFADSVPQSFKLSPFRTKIILKEAFRGLIPDELLVQPKRGWFSPGAKWLRYPHVATYAREVLSSDYTPATRDLFNWRKVQELLEAHLKGEYHFNPLWAILSLQIWARQFKITS